jgi:Transposase DDE domain
VGESFFGLGEYPGQKGGTKTGKNPTDKGKAGTKHHLVSDRRGVPLAVIVTAANVHDSMVFEELIDAIEPIKGPRGRPRKRPKKLHADKAYDDKKCKAALRKRSIKISG